MSELPTAWVTTSLGSVIELNPKNTGISDETLVGFVPMALLGKSYLDSVSFQPKLWGEVKRGYSHFCDGDVLLAKITPCFENGKAGLAIGLPNGIGAGSTEYFVCRPREGVVNARYLLAFLKKTEFLSLGATRMTGSVGHKRVPKEYLCESNLPLAPLAEQTRIADQLDKLLARIQACNDRLDAIPALLKRFRQAVLTVATSGALTEDWRAQRVARMQPSAESGNCVRDAAEFRYEVTVSPDSAALHPGYGVERDTLAGWQQTSVQTIAQVGTGSTPLRSNPAYFAEVGTPWITSAATSQMLVTKADEFVTSEAIAAHRLKTYPVGTLLVAMYGEGKTRGQVTELGIPATINQACAAVIVDESKANRAYVKLVLQANYFKMRELAEGGNQPNLNLSKVKEFPLALPCLQEQSEIVRRVEALFQLADRIEARYTAARAQAKRITPLLLAKAFRGELVPQDPDDEPAEALLARLRAPSDSAPSKRRGRSGKSPSP